VGGTGSTQEEAIAGPGTGLLALTGNGGSPMCGEANLPAGLYRKVCYPHPVRSAPGTRGNTLVRREVLVAGTRAAGELDDQALAHEVRAIYVSLSDATW
jgi:hypothetical protein